MKADSRDERRSESEAEVSEPSSFGEWFWEGFKTWAPAVIAVILIRSFVFEPFSIPSQSMVPTLLIGDHVLVTKFSYGLWWGVPFTDTNWEFIDWGDPDRGDIIVFRYPRDRYTNYIKRVVGVPGDEIEVRNNRILVNGKEQKIQRDGEYTYKDQNCRVMTADAYTEQLGDIAHTVLMDQHRFSGLANAGPFRVSEGQVFVMGDNRDHSGDSREWGTVDFDLIKGKAHFVWFSFDGCSQGFSVRSDRLFQGLYQ